MTSEIEKARQELRKAESTVARLQGEERALQAQVEAAKARLQQYGINPEQAAEALVALDAERDRLQAELTLATTQLTAVLASA